MLKLSFVIDVKPGKIMLKILLMLSYILEIEIFLTYMLLNIFLLLVATITQEVYRPPCLLLIFKLFQLDLNSFNKILKHFPSFFKPILESPRRTLRCFSPSKIHLIFETRIYLIVVSLIILIVFENTIIDKFNYF